MSRTSELRELTRIRILLFVREKEAVFWVVAFPLILAAVLGFAFRDRGITPSPIGVVDGPGADALVERLESYPGLELERVDVEEGRRLVERGKLDAVVSAPEEEGTAPGVLLDRERPEAETARLRILAALDPADADARVRLEEVEEVGSRYIDFLFPGLLGMNLMGTSMWGIGFAIADTRQKKLLRRLLVTPMRRSSFLLSFVLSRFVFLVGEVVLLVAFGVWVLGVPFHSGVAGFAALCLLGAFSFAGLGLLCASRARTIEGMSGLLNLVMMPMWLASGVFFSYERFPESAQPVLRLLPLSTLNDSLRALTLDGAGFLDQGFTIVTLGAWSVLSFALALRIFRWE